LNEDCEIDKQTQKYVVPADDKENARLIVSQIVLSQRLAAGQSHPGSARLIWSPTYERIDAKGTFHTKWEKESGT
jgi:hypothetical protein